MGKRKNQQNGGSNSNVFIVETIIKKKLRNNKEPLYFIKWKDWDDKFNTWEPSSNILDTSLIDQFEEEEREKAQSIKPKVNNIFEDLKNCFPSNVSDTAANTETKLKSEISDEIEKPPLPDSGSIQDRPKICLKISKHRIQSPSDSIKSDSSKTNDEKPEIFNYKVEHKVDKNNNTDVVSPSSNITPTISKISSPVYYKPRKLLSINEYSGILKLQTQPPTETHNNHQNQHQRHHSHHSHSNHRHKKHRNRHSSKSTLNSCIKLQKSPSSKPTPHIESSPSSSSTSSSSSTPSLSLPHTTSSPSSPIAEAHLTPATISISTISATATPLPTAGIPIKFNRPINCVITDVRVNGLSLTIRELDLDGQSWGGGPWISDSEAVCKQLVRIPKSSSWFDRICQIPSSNDLVLFSETEDNSDIDVVGGVEDINNCQSYSSNLEIHQSQEESESVHQEPDHESFVDEDNKNDEDEDEHQEILPQLKPAPWLLSSNVYYHSNYGNFEKQPKTCDETPIDLSFK